MKASKCRASNWGRGWGMTRRDCFMTMMHDGFDLDPLDVEADKGCVWTKHVYIREFVDPKRMFGMTDWKQYREELDLRDMKN